MENIVAFELNKEGRTHPNQLVMTPRMKACQRTIKDVLNLSLADLFEVSVGYVEGLRIIPNTSLKADASGLRFIRSSFTMSPEVKKRKNVLSSESGLSMSDIVVLGVEHIMETYNLPEPTESEWDEFTVKEK